MDSIKVCSVESPVGVLQLGATRRGLCLLEFSDRQSLSAELGYLRNRLDLPVAEGRNEIIEQATEELDAYFAGDLKEFQTLFDILGTPFQEQVWKELRRIPYGQTVSYGELARRVGRPKGPRAVGQANGRNRIAIAIPCHRVVQRGGKLGGYGGGLTRKDFLLKLEMGVVARSAVGCG